MSSGFPKIGIALSGGAARGNAHVGVLRAFAENNIPIDFVAGTSAGAIVGGAFAAGMPLDEIEQLGRKLRWRKIGRITISHLGIQTNARLERYLRERLPISKFEDLRIPFAAVATDLKTGAAVVMRDSGDVPFAIRASCTIPGWYVPVKDEHGRQLVDGGFVAVLPTMMVRSLGADIVIGVDVNADGASFFGSSGSIIGVILQSMLALQKTASHNQVESADLVIRPKVGHIRWDQMRRADELIAAGYKAGLESIPHIRALMNQWTPSSGKLKLELQTVS